MATAHAFRGREITPLDDPSDWRPDGRGDSLLWIDVDAEGERDRDDIAAALDLSPEALGPPHPSARPSFEEAAGYLQLVLQAPGEERKPVSVRCLVADDWVVTIHEEPVAALVALREQAMGPGPTGELDGFGFVAMLGEWVVGAYEAAFDAIERDLEEIDLEAMQTRAPTAHEQLEKLVALRAQVGTTRRSLVAHRWLLAALSHPELVDIGEADASERVAALRERFREAIEASRDAREAVFNSFDVLIARTGQRTNDIVRLLTIASFLFLPGTLMAGLLGMNFDVPIFDWTWLFWVVLVALAAFAVGTLLVARHRSWL